MGGMMDILTIARRLKAIYNNDKTQYDYHGRIALNRFGESPRLGSCWCTPAEIAQSTLKEMGYEHPREVPEGKE